MRQKTYSPALTVLVPKLPPTVPVHVQVFPAELVHVALAVAPTLTQVTDASANVIINRVMREVSEARILRVVESSSESFGRILDDN